MRTSHGIRLRLEGPVLAEIPTHSTLSKTRAKSRRKRPILRFTTTVECESSSHRYGFVMLLLLEASQPFSLKLVIDELALEL